MSERKGKRNGISFKKALRIAKRVKPNVDCCTEMTDAYLFGCSKDDWAMTGEGPVAVLKDGGEVYDLATYRAISRFAREIRTYDLYLR